MNCRAGCGACCIAPSITSSIPGMPNGKPAGVKCINLDENNFCKIHGQEGYPDFCAKIPASLEMCGDCTEYAMKYLSELEELTK